MRDLKDIAAAFSLLDLDRHAFFFDFDGTLAEFHADPLQVVLETRLRDDLIRLGERTAGAVAIISGRHRWEIAERAGNRIPVAGLHGTDFPGDEIDVADHAARVAAVRPLLPALQALVQAHPGTILEDKDQGLALHWRAAPLSEPQMLLAIQDALSRLGDRWSIQLGKFVAEIRPAGGDKGTALRRFMAQPAFQGRKPVAFGDDLNDLPMLDAARELGGIAVVLGERDLPADLRMSGPGELALWLERRLA